jgi:hypothetical protein
MNRPLAGKVTLDEDTMWVFLVDGRTIGIPLAYFPRLLEAARDRTTRPLTAR